ncbi:MAG: lamin tail domain-containing protein [Acidobacteriota bacterium]|nr:lamin tail domain-containing protein [Acidobacteriota bacterium]
MPNTVSLFTPRRSRVVIFMVAALSAVSVFVYQMYRATPAQALSSTIVISQVYGGGGNSGATFTHDFIELFNRGTTPASLSGWSVQYASAAGTSWAVTPLTNVTLQPGQYYLVQEAQGAGGTANLPTPDATGTIAMSATAGKVALVNSTTVLTGTGCPFGASIIDFVGFGIANCFEGAGPTPTLSNTTAALRAMAGCTETDNNAGDFSAGAPTPRNTASALNSCAGGPPSLSINDVSVAEGDSGTTTASFTVSLSSPAPPGGVTFDIATQDGTATIADNDYVAKSLVGQTISSGNDEYIFDVVVNGDTNVESNETFLVNVTDIVGAGNTSDQGVGTITNDDVAPTVFEVVISQVYGGGGNSGATLRNDFIELYNRGLTTVNLSGWSVQYSSAAGSGWQITPLNGSIAPGAYYLVQEAAGAGGSVNLPTPDATGGIAMGAGGGRVALSTSTTAFISNSCPAGGSLVDLVGYGSATCFEGSGPTAPPSNTTAALRKRGGCVDTNNNAADFTISSPNPRNSFVARSCDYTAAAIHDIQGSGLITPFLGQDVITAGVVTGRKTNGFFMQEPDASVDANPATSEGIFVFVGGAPAVAVGDMVSVRGTASEFFNLTQLDSTLPNDVTVTSSGSPLPNAVTFTMTILNPAGTTTQLERFEGMRMHADTLVSVAPTNNFGEIFTVLAGVPRPLREPGIEISLPVPPDPTSGMPDCCIPRWDENPERIMIDTDGLIGSSAISVTSNVTISNVTGPLDFSFGDYKVLPELAASTTANMSAVPVPTPAADQFTVASFNIENFNNNETQRRKAALAIRTVLRYPDVIGHVEIANLTSLQALAIQVNDDAVAAGDPNPTYEARLIPASQSTQNVGFLVRTSRVRIDSVTQEELPGCVGTAATCNTFIDPNTNQPALLNDRPPLVLRATIDSTGANPRQVIVIVNHLRSFIDIEMVTGEGPRVRAKRKAQGEFLANLLQELQTNNPTTAIISVGDYNAYEFNDGYTDPIATIKGTPTSDDEVVVDQSPDVVFPDFINLTDGLPVDQRYSFIFEGTPQALDHVIVNTVAHSYLQRYAIARNNADFPEVPSSLFANDVTRPERNSDHDMPVAYFSFPPTITLSTNPLTLFPPNHSYRTITVSDMVVSAGDTGDPNLDINDVVIAQVTSDEVEDAPGSSDGNTFNDIVIAADCKSVQLRAERDGALDGRVYTVTLKVTDASGNVTTATRQVTVRLSPGRGNAVDSGPMYAVTSGCP